MVLFDDNTALWTEDSVFSCEDYDKELLYQPSDIVSMHAPPTPPSILEGGDTLLYACTFSQQMDQFSGFFDGKKDCPFNWEDYLHFRMEAPQPEKVPRAYSCPQCGKHFPTKYRLVSHQTVHSPVKKFTCEICNKRFARSHDLKRHVRGHSNKLSMACFLCGKSFSRRDALKRHMESFCK